MKRIFLSAVVVCMAMSSFAQFTAMTNNKAKVVAPVPTVAIDLPVTGPLSSHQMVSSKTVLDDPYTAVTRYDLQSNYSNPRRIYCYPDGTIGANCTWSTQDLTYSDRGSGYNYYDGTSWGPVPVARVENIRVGWGEYVPFGDDGEMIIAHQATGPLVISKRLTKGNGAWTQTTMPALPSTIKAMAWPRAITNGPNHTNIHVIALTLPTANGGFVYDNMDGALLYCNSTDGGTTWTSWQELPGMGPANYINFSADSYAWADPKGDTIAFTTGSAWKDQFVMKSTDNGSNWTKIMVHPNPYNLGGNSPGFFYASDETMAIAMDNEGFVHVVFGLTQDSGSPSAGYYRPYSQGIAYWNEHMPPLGDLNIDSLNNHNQLVGWVADTNVFYPPSGVTLATYYTSLTSNPELKIDKQNKVYLAWAGSTLLTDPDNFTLRHIFARDGVIKPEGDILWHHGDSLVDLTSDFVQYNFSECMYPSATLAQGPAAVTPGVNVYILFQCDDKGGSWVKNQSNPSSQGQQLASDNYMTVLSWGRAVWEGQNNAQKPELSVAQNVPNPVSGFTKINCYMQNPGNLSLKLTSLTGQVLMTMEKTNVHAGVAEFDLDGSQLAPGIYFYTVKQGNTAITRKMIVQ